MNTLKHINETVFFYLGEVHPAFRALTLADDVISYKGQSVILGNFSLQEFANINGFILGDLNSSDLFNVIKVHAEIINKIIPPSPPSHETTILKPISITGSDEEVQKQPGIIALDRFILLVNADYKYEKKDEKELDRLWEIVTEILVYEDFLIPEAKMTLEIIRNILNSIQDTDNKSVNYDYLINSYNEVIAKSVVRKDSLYPIMIELKLSKSGFIDISILMTVLFDIGITIAIIFLMFKK